LLVNLFDKGTKRKLMRQQKGKQRSDTACVDSRHHRRAFRKALSNGLKEAFQEETRSSVPSEFLELLNKADNKVAKL
jgi:hypothetical protein